MSNTNTGLFRVSKIRYSKNQYRFQYQINNELVFKQIRRVNLLDLKKEVEKQGFLWGIVDLKKATTIANENKIPIAELEGKYGWKPFQFENGLENLNLKHRMNLNLKN